MRGGREGESTRGARWRVHECVCVCVRANGKGRVDGHNASDGADDGDITNASAVTKSLFDYLFFFLTDDILGHDTL